MTLNCRGATTRGQVSARYDSLPQPDSVSLASYVWIDNRGETLLHKMRTVEFVPARADELPWWDCSEDLSGQHLNVDIFMEPVRLFNDPFFTHNHTSHIANTTAGHTSAAHNVNKLVLCQTYNYEKKIAESNKRANCCKTLARTASSTPLFIIEQTYRVLDKRKMRPLDQPPMMTSTSTAGRRRIDNTCAVGATRTFGRELAESHLKACLYAGIRVRSLCNVDHDRWRFEIGPCDGIELGDHLWMARFVLHRVGEDFGCVIRYDADDQEEEDEEGARSRFGTRVFVKTEEMLSTGDASSSSNNFLLESCHQLNACEDETRASLSLSSSIACTISEEHRGYLQLSRPYSVDNFDPYEVVTSLVDRILPTTTPSSSSTLTHNNTI